VKKTTAGGQLLYNRNTIYGTSGLAAAGMLTASPESVRKSATVEESASYSRYTGCQMLDARCQMPEMSETVWKPQANNSRVFPEIREKLVIKANYW
jgi:hypothetical protein